MITKTTTNLKRVIYRLLKKCTERKGIWSNQKKVLRIFGSPCSSFYQENMIISAYAHIIVNGCVLSPIFGNRPKRKYKYNTIRQIFLIDKGPTDNYRVVSFKSFSCDRAVLLMYMYEFAVNLSFLQSSLTH